MNDHILSDDLELVTDPNLTRLFPMPSPDIRQLAFPFMPQKPKVISFQANEMERQGLLARLKRKSFPVFDENGNINPQPRCTWRESKLARFISRYVYFYKKPASDTRTYILSQLESVAKEHHVILPKPSEMQTRKPKRRFDCEIVDHTQPSRSAEFKAYYDGANIVAYMPGENIAAERERYERTKWDELLRRNTPCLKTPRTSTKRARIKPI